MYINNTLQCWKTQLTEWSLTSNLKKDSYKIKPRPSVVPQDLDFIKNGKKGGTPIIVIIIC